MSTEVEKPSRLRRRTIMNNYRSRFEAQVGKFLELNNVRFEYETVKLPYKSRIQSGVCDKCGHNKTSQNRTYTPDFVLIDLGIILEVKGHLSPTDRAKMLAVKSAHPEKDIRLIFMSNNKVKKNNSEYRYSDWAEEHGFPYAVKTVPLEWLA